jgi:hypothetical protein
MKKCLFLWAAYKIYYFRVQKVLCYYFQKDLYLLYLNGCGVTD